MMTDFFEMGGYGVFVWLAYGISVSALTVMLVSSKVKAKRLSAKADELKLSRKHD